MSADYSFDCIPLLKSLLDWRNVGWIMLYTIFGVIIFRQASYLLSIFKTINSIIVSENVNSSPQVENVRKRLRVNQSSNLPALAQPDRTCAIDLKEKIAQMEVVRINLLCLGWMVVPFLPASHVFLNVGTMIAERLLYLPSIGYCLFLVYFGTSLFTMANETGRKMSGHLANMQREFMSDSNVESSIDQRYVRQIHGVNQMISQPESPTNRSARHKTKRLIWILVIMLITLYSWKTWERNKDWKSEELLFESAYKVCPNSVKVLQNYGILYRRRQVH